MQAITVFFGMIASGKSTLAERFARSHDLLYLNTDRVRKELAGLAPTERRPDGIDQGIYTADFTRRTYAAMLARAAESLAAGRGVVLDGSYSRRQERDAVRECAARAGVPVSFILCTCDDETVAERLAQRARDQEAVSDGRWEIYQYQKDHFDWPDTNEQAYILRTEEDPESLQRLVEHWMHSMGTSAPQRSQ